MVNFLIQPLNIFFCVMWIGLILLLFNRIFYSILLISISTIFLTIITILPITQWITIPLEQRFPIPIIDKPPYGIIVLGGAEKIYLTSEYNQVSLNSSAERLIIFNELSKKYPNSKLIFSGGGKNIINKKRDFKVKESYISSESDVAKLFLNSVDNVSSKIFYEEKSSNTFENALNIRDIIGINSNKHWILITSAISMPRAFGTFEKAGINVTPYPVDYKYGKYIKNFTLNFNFTARNQLLNNAIYEWVGLIYYKLLNRTDSFFPG